MSWGSEAANNGGAAASNASSAPSVSTPAASGFQLDNATAPTPALQGADGNMQTLSMWDQAGDTLDRFQKGQGQSLGQTFKTFGNNPETYGYAAAKLQQLSKSGGGGGGAAPITTNISYRPPDNTYLEGRRRRY